MGLRWGYITAVLIGSHSFTQALWLRQSKHIEAYKVNTPRLQN